MTDYYVRTDGSNSNDGLTNSSDGAFLTIQYAVDNVSGSGDVINVIGPGTFAEEVEKRNDGDNITILGVGDPVVEHITIREDDDCTIDSMKFASSSTSLEGGVWLHTANNTTVTNCTFTDMACAAIFGLGNTGQRSNNCTITNNTITGCQAGIVCYGDTSGGGWLINNNSISDITFRNSQTFTDCDACRVLSGDDHVFTNNLIFGNTLENVFGKFWGTHTGGTHSTVMTDSTLVLATQPTSAYVGATIKNLTDGSQGTITAASGTTITCSGGLSGGTNNEWQTNDEWATSNFPHLDGLQVFTQGVADDVYNLTVTNNYITLVGTAFQIENQNGGNGNFVYRNNVCHTGLENKYNEKPVGNGPISASDLDQGTNYFEFNTFHNWGVRAVFTGCSGIRFNDNICNDVDSSGYVFNTETDSSADYNITWPDASPDAGANDINSDPLFVDESDILGADGIFFTDDDGLHLGVGSPGIGAASNSLNIGAYQSTERYRARQL